MHLDQNVSYNLSTGRLLRSYYQKPKWTILNEDIKSTPLTCNGQFFVDAGTFYYVEFESYLEIK